MSNFSSLNLPPQLRGILTQLGFTRMSEVQEQAIPRLLRRESLVVKAPTGSGKTLAYLVPILADLEPERATQAVLIVPTKVLANQVLGVLRQFKRAGLAFSVAALLDGSTAGIKTSANIVITTPALAVNLPLSADLSHLKRTIFDEGDMLLFGGFAAEVEAILSSAWPGSTAIFTASIDEHLDALVKRYIRASALVDVTNDRVTAAGVSHHFVDIRTLSKGAALIEFLSAVKPYKAIIFASQKKDLEPLQQALRQAGYDFSFVHGDLPKRDQKRALNEFIRDETHLLLASDIAARGVDIPDVTDVVSVDLPKDLVYYFHRAGRSGRFDRSGNSYIFYSSADADRCRELLKKGLTADYSTLKDGALKADRDLKSLPKKKVANAVLDAAIARAVRENRSRKVRPNYKKKVKKAVERVKDQHRRKIIRTNLKARQSKDE